MSWTRGSYCGEPGPEGVIVGWENKICRGCKGEGGGLRGYDRTADFPVAGVV